MHSHLVECRAIYLRLRNRSRKASANNAFPRPIPEPAPDALNPGRLPRARCSHQSHPECSGSGCTLEGHALWPPPPGDSLPCTTGSRSATSAPTF